MTRSNFQVEVGISGTEAAAERIRHMGASAANTRPLMAAVAELLAEQQRARVQSTPWAPLSANTVARKVNAGENPAIFRSEWRMIDGKATRTANQLWEALTAGGKGQIKRATRTYAVFGISTRSDLYYARFVQNVKGTKRRLLGISAGDADAIVTTIAKYFVERDELFPIGEAETYGYNIPWPAVYRPSSETSASSATSGASFSFSSSDAGAAEDDVALDSIGTDAVEGLFGADVLGGVEDVAGLALLE